MDDGPSPSARVSWSERMLLKIRLAALGDGRKKVKAIIRTADAWRSDGRYEAARTLYRQAIELAEEFRIHHLFKVATKRLSELEQAQGERSEAERSREASSGA